MYLDAIAEILYVIMYSGQSDNSSLDAMQGLFSGRSQPLIHPFPDSFSGRTSLLGL